jgi:hypothetical protein
MTRGSPKLGRRSFASAESWNVSTRSSTRPLRLRCIHAPRGARTPNSHTRWHHAACCDGLPGAGVCRSPSAPRARAGVCRTLDRHRHRVRDRGEMKAIFCATKTSSWRRERARQCRAALLVSRCGFGGRSHPEHRTGDCAGTAGSRARCHVEMAGSQWHPEIVPGALAHGLLACAATRMHPRLALLEGARVVTMSNLPNVAQEAGSSSPTLGLR